MDLSSYKAFLFDVDKTLSNSKKELSPVTRLAVKKVVSKGYHAGVCTGRSLATLHSILPSLFTPNSRHIVSGGAQIIATDGRVIWEQTIPEAVSKEIVSKAKANGGAVVISYQDALYTETVNHPYSTIGGTVVNVKNLKELTSWSLPIITVYKTNNSFYTYLDSKKEIAYKKMTSYENVPYVDITPIGVSKASAIHRWCGMVGIEPQEIVGFGDSENDVEFLQVVGHAVAMGNASDKVKSIADEVTYDCDHDGVAKWIEAKLKA